MSRSKGLGGLGSQQLEIKKLALLASLAWHAFHSNSLWAHVLQNKHLGRRFGFSPSWKALIQGWGHRQIGLQWQLGNRKHIKFFIDAWIAPNTPLRNLIHGPLLQHELTSKVSQYRVTNGWSFSQLSFDLPDSITSLINVVHFSHYLPSAADKIKWGLTDSKNFIVESCYDGIFSSIYPNTSNLNFSWIWKLDVPPKIKHFL